MTSAWQRDIGLAVLSLGVGLLWQLNAQANPQVQNPQSQSTQPQSTQPQSVQSQASTAASATASSNAALPNAVLSGATLPSEIYDTLMVAGIRVEDVSMVISPLDGAPDVVNHLGALARTPASTQKLVSTAIALDVLGADFHWHNNIYLRGALIGDTLYGDVLIRGSGDPSLTHDRLDALMAALAKRVRHVRGDVLIDDGLFYQVGYDANAFDGQGWRAYNAEPSAFLVNFGTLEVRFVPSGRYALVPKPAVAAPDDIAKTQDSTASTNVASQSTQNVSVQSASVQTPTTQAQIAITQATSAQNTPAPSAPVTPVFIANDKASAAAVQLLPRLDDFESPQRVASHTANCQLPQAQISQTAATLTGEFGAGCGAQSLWRNFGDNRALAVKAVAASFKKAGGQVDGEVRMATGEQRGKDGFSYLAWLSQPSKPLAEQIWQINQYSNNVMTEQLALSLPIYALGAPYGSYAASHAFIDNWWRQKLGTTPPVISRASGLCRDCRIVPDAMVSLLKYMHTHPEFAVFLNTLPVAGKTGTMAALARRNPDHPAIDRAWIKTGTLNDVTSMAGYVQAQSGRWYAVAGFVNAKDAGYNPKALAILDAMLAWTVQR